MWQKIIGNKIYIAILLSSVFIVGLAGTYFGLLVFSKPKLKAEDIKKDSTGQETSEQNSEPINTKGSYSVVLLGSGGGGHSGGGLTDSIIIVSVDSKAKKAALISIPRDLWVPGNYKINAAANNIGVENVKGTLQNVTGLKIEKYISVDFSGIAKLIDSLGGIEVDIPKAYDDYFYPVAGLENETCGKTPEEIASLHHKYSGFELEKQFICRYEHIHFVKGLTKIDGKTVLKYARSRHGDSDFGRSARQFVILKGILGKLLFGGYFNKIDETFASMTKIVKTDLTLSQAKELARLFGKPGDYKIVEIHLTDGNVLNSSKSTDGQYILIPKAGANNFSGIKKFISGQ